MNELSHLIAEIKLNELRHQKCQLLEQYSSIEQHAQAKSEWKEQLQILYDGLKNITFAQQPLHAEIANLEAFLFEIQYDFHAEEVIKTWCEKLRQEIRQGRKRTEYIYLFGCLLEEWLKHTKETARKSPEEKEAFDQAVSLLQKPGVGASPDFLSSLEELYGDFFARFDEDIQKSRYKIYRKVSKKDVQEALSAIAKRQEYSNLSSQMKEMEKNDLLTNEYAGVLSILIHRFSEWHWPDSGLRLKPMWKLNKWRAYLTTDLVTLLFLEIIGIRWRDLLQNFVCKDMDTFVQRSNRLKRLARLQELKAPRIILDNERRLLEELDDGSQELEDIEDDSIAMQRILLRKERLFSMSNASYAGYGMEENEILQKFFLQLNAEICIARACPKKSACQTKPVFIVSADIKDFYLTLDHSLILRLLKKIGMQEQDLGFASRFLDVSIQGIEGKVKRGVPIGYIFSHVCAEIFLYFLDEYVKDSSGVELIRTLDDMFFVTTDAGQAVKAWEAIQKFCHGCGLSLNQEKCGAVCIGGKKPDVLPAHNPRWHLLELNQDGEWIVNEPSLQKMHQYLQSKINDEGISVLSIVSVYNSWLDLIIPLLAPFAHLGRKHLDTIGTRLADFHNNPQYGVLPLIKSRIRQKLTDERETLDMFDAWMYWPVTAGGLGLVNPMLELASFGIAQDHLPEIPDTRDDQWLIAKNDWSKLYTKWMGPVKPQSPVDTTMMQGLIQDFIHRGTEVSGHKQITLRRYWKWILCTYGTQIIEKFGTFRFLMTEMVPMALILEKKQASGKDKHCRTCKPDDDIPF